MSWTDDSESPTLRLLLREREADVLLLAGAAKAQEKEGSQPIDKSGGKPRKL
ncbi:MAG TPA: hypothetical protein VGB07_36630 [Blastocatellia bacterium]